jgi:hypothetical protein
MLAAEDRFTVLAVLDSRKPLAQATADATGQHLPAEASSSRYEPTMSRFELLGSDERLVATGKPLAVVEDFAEVDAGLEDESDRRVLDASAVLDPLMTQAFGSQTKDLAHQRRLLVRDEDTAAHVVAGLGAVDPSSLLDRLLHAHPDVLGQLLPVELRERAEHVVEHPPCRAREVDLLGERVQRDTPRPERVCQGPQVFDVAGQSIELPHQNMTDVAAFDHLEETLQPGTIQVLARQPRVGDEQDLAQVMQLRIGRQAAGLSIDRVPLLGLLLGRDPAVRDRQHRSPPRSCSPYEAPR